MDTMANDFRGFYQWCRARGIYLNVPDWYYSPAPQNAVWAIAKRTGPCRASNRRSLSDKYLRRHLEKTPSMGGCLWPLTEYQGGGTAATLNR